MVRQNEPLQTTMLTCVALFARISLPRQTSNESLRPGTSRRAMARPHGAVSRSSASESSGMRRYRRMTVATPCRQGQQSGRSPAELP